MSPRAVNLERRGRPGRTEKAGRLAAGCVLLGLVLSSGPADEAGPAGGETPPDETGAPRTRGKIIVRPSFEPSWQSLGSHRIPDWFRDAKLGFWAHWGPQSVPMQGDWYARWLYGPYAGTEDWERDSARARRAFHERRYGHPSAFGYKDICRLWKAERFDPDELMRLYKRAGGRYFVTMGAHADNFDLWDSDHQPWNAANVGPKKDIVGMWAQAARRNDLPFGVSLHSAWAWRWIDVAFSADTQGPLAGVPYDGRLTRADGRGRWWEGLDPRDLYCRPHRVGEPPDRSFVENFYARARDVVEKYRPDLVYFDDSRLPFDEGSVRPADPPSKAGLRFVADYYNESARWHGGLDEALVTIKNVPGPQREAVALDVERGQVDALQPSPWQADTCIGDWFYKQGARYKTTREIVQMLVDVVSKNGNLLLNLPQRPDGTLDAAELRILRELTGWMDVNGEAIHGTRPWTLYGEGPTPSGSGHFSEQERGYTAADLRFTAKGRTLYVFALAWPEDRKLLVRSLARGSTLLDGHVKSLELLGREGALRWEQTKAGLEVELPAERPCDFAYVLRVALP